MYEYFPTPPDIEPILTSTEVGLFFIGFALGLVIGAIKTWVKLEEKEGSCD